MTVYNREKFLAEAIESVLQSTLQDWELIILDDCSVDTSYAIAQSFASNEDRIKLYKNKTNIGQFENRNKIAGYAKGKYLKYLDSDDAIFDFGLEYCVKEMEKFPEVGIGMLYLRDRSLTETFVLDSETIIRDHYFKGSILSIGPSGCIYNRVAFEKTGGFDTRFGVASDNKFNIEMASKYPVLLLSKVYFNYRIHDGQEQNNEKDYLIKNYLYNKEIFNHCNLPLQKEENSFLKRKLEKRQLINLVKYFIRNRNIKDLLDVIKTTHYKWWNAYKYIFY